MYFIRPMQPTAVAIHDLPDEHRRVVRVLMEELVGLTKVDADCYRVHRKTYGNDDTRPER